MRCESVKRKGRGRRRSKTESRELSDYDAMNYAAAFSHHSSYLLHIELCKNESEECLLHQASKRRERANSGKRGREEKKSTKWLQKQFNCKMKMYSFNCTDASRINCSSMKSKRQRKRRVTEARVKAEEGEEEAGEEEK